MSKENPQYPPIIKYLNNLSNGQIFTIDEACKKLSKLDNKYVKSTIRLLSQKEFYIGKNMNKDYQRRIDSYFKRRNIPTDKKLTDILWFLKYDL